MPGIIEHLRSLDRKERFAVLRDALGFDVKTPCLDRDFCERLGKCIGVDVPERAFLAMDYHLDWIQIAFHLDANSDIESGRPFLKPDFGDINRDQEDIDLLVAFESKDAGRVVTHLVLIEAKAYLSWTNKQLNSKVGRLCEIFGDDGERHEAVKPHFVLMTGRLSGDIHAVSWPNWMKNSGNPRWLEYNLPARTKVTRCTDGGRPYQKGTHLRLDNVPPLKQ